MFLFTITIPMKFCVYVLCAFFFFGEFLINAWYFSSKKDANEKEVKVFPNLGACVRACISIK